MTNVAIRSVPLLLLLALAAHVPAQTVHSGKIPVDWTRATMQETDGVLDIVLKPVDGMDWMVGVKVRAGAENTISVGDGTRGRMFQKLTGQAAAQPKIAPHNPDEVAIAGSSVSISGGADGQVLVVYIDLSHARAITIRDGKGLSNFANVTDGIIIENGTVLRNGLFGQSDLVQMAMLGLNEIRASFGFGPVIGVRPPDRTSAR